MWIDCPLQTYQQWLAKVSVAEHENTQASQRARDAMIVYVFLGQIGKRCTKNEVMEAVSASPRDNPFDWASDAVSGFGFICNSGKTSISDITPAIVPALVLGKDGQMAIVERVSKDRISIYESVNGKKRHLTKTEFKAWYAGRLLFAQPALEDHKTIKSRLKALSPLRTLGMSRFLWIALAALISNILGLSTSLFIMVVYDRVLPNQAIESLYALAIGVGLAIVFDSVLKGARGRIVERASVSADIAVNEDIFEQFVEVSNTKDRKSVGELSSIMRDFEVYRDFMSSATILTLVDLPFVLVFVGVIYMIGGPLFIVPLICIPTILIVILAIQPILARNSAAVSASAQSRQGLLVEFLGGLEALRVNGAFALMKRKFLTQSNFYAKAAHQAKSYAQLNGNTITIVQQVAQVAIIVYGFHLFVDQVITMGAIIATVILSGRALAPLAKVGQTLGRANAAYVARGNLKRFLSAPRMHNDDTISIIKNKESNAVEISNATLRLSEMGRPLFNGLNLSIKKGEKVAIVGRTGSGKTSLVKLIIGLLTPETGTVMINGSDIRQYARADLFRTVGTVFQDPWLFSGTLRDNVALGQDDCSEEQVINCLKAAGADFIGDGKGSDLDFFIQDQGNNLSGGQKQAVMIARALAFTPDIYLFDEPTSAMDGLTESHVISHLFSRLARKTLIIVTHKTPVVAMCDRVIVMDQGKIVGDGSKESYFELLKKRAEQRA
jgi:ATP-binding cassette subfamily C protein LapB